MEFDKKTLLAFLLIGLVLFLIYTPFYQKTFMPDQYERMQRQKALQDSLQAIGFDPETALADKSQPSISEEYRPLQETKKEPGFEKKASIITTDDRAEQHITISTPVFLATFSNRGASLIGFTLKEFLGPEGENVELIPADAYGTLGLSFYQIGGDTLSTHDWMFDSPRDTAITLTEKDQRQLVFTYDFGNGKQIKKLYTFYGDRYDFHLDVKFINMHDVIAEKIYFLDAPAGLLSTEKRLGDDMHYAKAILASGTRVEKDFKDSKKVYRESGAFDWLAVRTKYFSLTLIPEKKPAIFARIQLDEVEVSGQKDRWKQYDVSLGMPFLNTPREGDLFRIYIGPLDDDILKSYGRNLEKMMDFGHKIIQPFSLAILWTFKKIHTVVPNYGVVLIIFAFLIKIIVWPLTHKSYESMNKIKKLQPKLEELKAKHGKDQQRYQKEMMALYKQEKVNPMGGCLPMVLQMPLLWGLFIVFRSTIELRGAAFFGWIQDLSMPDTVFTLPFSLPIYGDSVNVLPLLMGLTMILQQKMSVTDPKQKAMVYIMPIFFTLLFNTFPSGLNLYYALFNLLSILQQRLVVSKDSNDGTKEQKSIRRL
ncbi:membrane protein insertase YidC [candidate division KSB1 bacterium]|nr:membrane protein insertase YidC [candidate division KSB1 bacterium]